jgi:thiopeptide-type bacteriocin biosynthesis protein
MITIQRTFIPGSRWVYIKLYTGEKTADDLLIHIIAPVIKKLQKANSIEKWFFIRYYDPDFHLRIRLLTHNSQYVGEIIQQFYHKLNILNRNHLLWKVQLDTYNRELDRYDNRLIEEAESVFYADSECILSILKYITKNENYRWMIALKLINELLSDFGLSIGEKQKLLEYLSKSFKAEHGFNEFNSKQFSSKFRVNKKIIESVLDNRIIEKDFISLSQPIRKRTKRLKPIVEQIKLKARKDNNINELLKSYLHMTLNRLFRSKNRQHEMILYDFMFRYYSSEIAKKRYHLKNEYI